MARKFIVETRQCSGPYVVIKGGNGEVIFTSKVYIRPYSRNKIANKLAKALGTTVRHQKRPR